ncbi:MAG: hypothetical protein D3922_02065 [Candidatus Electrothrix sp. AR1]|nr:hypothetical protein [Candidatus Electrothrix sp. AR1]
MFTVLKSWYRSLFSLVFSYIPTKKQYKNWSLPSKLAALGFFLGVTLVPFTIVSLFLDDESANMAAKYPIETLEFVKQNFDWILSALVVSCVGILSSVLSYLIVNPKKQELKAKNELFNMISSYFDSGNELDLDFLKYINSSIEREFSVNIVISQLLEDFLVKLLTETNKNDQHVKYAGKIKQLIEMEIKIKPFDSLPSEERRLLKALRDSVSSNAASENANYFIDELSAVLSVRASEYQESHQTNKWSVPLAVIGLVSTIIFGVASIL